MQGPFSANWAEFHAAVWHVNEFSVCYRGTYGQDTWEDITRSTKKLVAYEE